MKKHRILWSLFLTISVFLCGCAKGNVENVNKIIGESEIFSADEIEDAMNVAITYFKNEFEGCTMTEIKYDEATSAKASIEWAAQYNTDEAILLISSFDVDSSGGDGSLTPNTTYSRWQWILTRSLGGEWTLRTWGYG